MVKKSLLWIYRAALWLIGITSVLILATVLIVHFFVLPNINHYKDKIAAFASQITQQKIEIGNIKADWQGINPHLSLSNLDIFDAQNRPALQLKNTEITLSWLSIPVMEPRLANLIIYSPELTVRRLASGEIFVAGVSMSGPSRPELPNWLLRQSQVEVLNAKVIWLDEMHGTPELSLNKLNLQISSPPWKSLLKHHHFTLSMLPSVGTAQSITFSGDVYGNDVSRFEEWYGDISMHLKEADITAFNPWIAPWIDTPINLQSGTGNAALVAEFSGRQLQSVASDLALNNVQIQPKNATQAVTLNKVTGKLNWQRLSSSRLGQLKQLTGSTPATGYSFDINQLTLSANNGLELKDVTANYAESGQDKQTVSLKLAHVDLALINPYFYLLPLPTEVMQDLSSLNPSGSLNNFALHWEGNKSSGSSYRISSGFSGLSIQAHTMSSGSKIPGFSNLTGEITANQNSGKLALNTENAKLDIKNILRWPVPIDKLNGMISWDTRGHATEIQTDKLTLSNPHLSGSVKASYLMDGEKGGYLDLKGEFGQGNAKYASFYYPIALGPTTLHWLDTSILEGRAEDINVTVKGRLADFPFVDSKNNLDSNLGLFRVTAKISNCLLEYGTGWPAIEGLGLDLLFEGKRMELNANTGHLYGNQIIKSKTTIAQLDAYSPTLNIASEIKGSVTEGVKFVNNSPVKLVTMGFTDDLKTSGSGKLNLNLSIPMQNLEAAKYTGSYQITDGVMDNDNIPTINHINGVLDFTESSLTAKNIKANAFGAPLVFNLNSGKDKIIRVGAKGKINDEALRQIFTGQGMTRVTNYLSGSTDWTGSLTIQKPRVNISIRSDLVGLSSHLPPPLDKAANERLSININKKQDPNTDTTSINLGNKFGAKIIRTANGSTWKVDRGAIYFDASGLNASALAASTDLGSLKGLQLSGNLDYLDADAWRNVARDLGDNGKPSTLPPIQKIALNINTLDLFDRRINQLKIQSKPAKDTLHFLVQSGEISGDVQWSDKNSGKLIAHLTHLSIPEATPTQARYTLPAYAKNNGKDPKQVSQNYPSLEITADTFEFDKKNYGALDLLAYPKNDSWEIQKLKLVTPESTISAEGEWTHWVQNPSTRLTINWDIKDLGKTLNRLGHADVIKGGEGQLSGQLNWTGSPHEFDTLALNGDLQFEIRKGQILKVQPGVGRLFGLLSLQSLPRRLTLDFRDLFSNGFAFDKVNATVKIDKGIMRSDNFAMIGPAADVTIKGETNIKKETQQLHVKVLPRVSDSLSLAALAGGPLAGAVAFLAQKLLKDPLNKIASTEYEIVGTWDNPQEVKVPEQNTPNDKVLPIK